MKVNIKMSSTCKIGNGVFITIQGSLQPLVMIIKVSTRVYLKVFGVVFKLYPLMFLALLQNYFLLEYWNEMYGSTYEMNVVEG